MTARRRAFQDLLQSIRALETRVLQELASDVIDEDVVPDAAQAQKRAERDVKRRDQIATATKRIAGWRASMGT